ncbi:hypothetical protein pb186bvf_009264 [Paramecium bursaria]
MIIRQPQGSTFSFGRTQPIRPISYTQPIIKINQPHMMGEPLKKPKVKTEFQQGYDCQEENKILKQYVQSMEQTLRDLQKSNYQQLLQQQLKENSAIRDQVQILQRELQQEYQEHQYLKKIFFQ